MALQMLLRSSSEQPQPPWLMIRDNESCRSPTSGDSSLLYRQDARPDARQHLAGAVGPTSAKILESAFTHSTADLSDVGVGLSSDVCLALILKFLLGGSDEGGLGKGH